MNNVSIPKMSSEELQRRYKIIKPIVSIDGKRYWLKDFSIFEIAYTSYLWNLDKTMISKEVEKDELEELKGRDFLCLHTSCYLKFFRPTIGEVLSQISDEDMEENIVAFEIIDSSKQTLDTCKDELVKYAFEQGYHVSKVRLYKRKNGWYKMNSENKNGAVIDLKLHRFYFALFRMYDWLKCIFLYID